MNWRRRARALWVAWGAAAAAAAVLAAIDPPWLDPLVLPAAIACLGAAVVELAVSRWADRRDGRHHRRARPRRDLTWWERNRDALTSQRRRWLGPAAAVVGVGSAFLPQSGGPRMQLVWLAAGLAAVVYAADVRLEEVAWRRERMDERKRERLGSRPDDLRLPAPASWEDGADVTPAQAAQWDAFVQRAADARREGALDDFAQLAEDVRPTV